MFARRGAGGRWRVNGLALGKYRVEGGVATPGTGGARFERRALARRASAPSEPMSVAELERRVREAR